MSKGNRGVSVFGLGYVGCVSAACFAKEGFSVVGVDTTGDKVDLINSGKPTILESGVAELVAAMVSAGRLRATTSTEDAVHASDISLVCVGTPSQSNGSLDLSFVQRVSQQIGEVLRDKTDFHVIVIRSTVLPGTIEQLIVPTLEMASGKTAGVDFGVVSNPEFLREGSSVKDFYDPPFTIVGVMDQKAGPVVASLYAGLDAPLHIVDLRTAEMVKYACNAFHAVKVGFANEIGSLAKALRIDSHEVMRLVCEDRKLNISTAYLRPGFAFGGSCLPKDLRALNYRAREHDLNLPLLQSALPANEAHLTRAFEMVERAGSKDVGVLGITFKAGTDDLRESPLVTLVERLIGRGYKLSIFDPDLRKADLVGTNRSYIEREIPHIWSLMCTSLDEILQQSSTIVVGNASPEFRDVPQRLQEHQVCIDLVRLPKVVATVRGYEGICW